MRLSLYEGLPLVQLTQACHKTGVYNPTLFEHWCGFFFMSHKNQISESAVRGDLHFSVLVGKD